jgi:hypothetical protein
MKAVVIIAFTVTLLCAVLSTVVAFRAHYEVDRLRKILDISPNGGLSVQRLVVKDGDGNSTVLQPGSARFFSPKSGRPGDPGVLITALGRPSVAILDQNGNERAVVGVIHTRETASGNQVITSEATISLFNADGSMILQLPP